jgi:hypothetical protein
MSVKDKYTTTTRPSNINHVSHLQILVKAKQLGKPNVDVMISPSSKWVADVETDDKRPKHLCFSECGALHIRPVLTTLQNMAECF